MPEILEHSNTKVQYAMRISITEVYDLETKVYGLE